MDSIPPILIWRIEHAPYALLSSIFHSDQREKEKELAKHSGKSFLCLIPNELKEIGHTRVILALGLGKGEFTTFGYVIYEECMYYTVISPAPLHIPRDYLQTPAG